jgi:HSP20 family protein
MVWAALPARGKGARALAQTDIRKGGFLMLTRWTDWRDFDRTFAMMDELRSRMDRLYGDYDAPRAAAVFPRISLFDTGSSLTLKAEVPGLTEKDIQLTINQDVVTLQGERKADAPEGYSVHRQERAPVKFSRSFTLPCRINAETTQASLKNGVLTVTLAKAAEAQPKQITVKAS